MPPSTDTALLITLDGLGQLLEALRARGYRTVGPTVRDATIVYEEISSIEDLPRGWTDEQSAGRYRLHRRDDEAVFGFAVGPHSWKGHLFPARQRLWNARREPGNVQVHSESPAEAPLALIGVRACELHAIAIHDRVWLGTAPGDAQYRRRRDGVFIVAVNCTSAGGTCFCASMHTGPAVTSGYDIALTELIGAPQPEFVLWSATEAARSVLEAVAHRPATPEQIAQARSVVARTAEHMGRQMPEADLPRLLLGNRESPRWNAIAERCLACGNCTLVCPTCFCTTVEDASDLGAGEFTRTRRWDSCFSVDFSYVHGGSVRQSVAARYRQWLTHKLGTWPQQFGTSGCVGCGRCITWCPVGIDITEEVAALHTGGVA